MSPASSFRRRWTRKLSPGIVVIVVSSVFFFFRCRCCCWWHLDLSSHRRWPSVCVRTMFGVRCFVLLWERERVAPTYTCDSAFENVIQLALVDEHYVLSFAIRFSVVECVEWVWYYSLVRRLITILLTIDTREKKKNVMTQHLFDICFVSFFSSLRSHQRFAFDFYLSVRLFLALETSDDRIGY